MIRTSLLATFLTCIFTIQAFADLTIVQKLETPDGDKVTGDITIYAADSKTRVDMGKEMSTISDDATKKVTTLMHSQKMAMEMPATVVEQMKQQMEASGANDLTAESFKSTGRKETINGFACEEYEFTVNGQKIASWFAKELKEKGDIADAFKKLSSSSNPMAASMAQFDAMPGVPIRTEVMMPGSGKTTITVQSISTDAIPAGVFAVPSEYRSMEMPAIPGIN